MPYYGESVTPDQFAAENRKIAEDRKRKCLEAERKIYMTTGTTAKHTKAPWSMTDMDNRGWIGIYSADCRTVADVVSQLPDETTANARLIAAAPDLLEALRECLPLLQREFEAHGTDNPQNYERVCCNLAKSAIARAEGR